MLEAALRPGGIAVIATFAEDGSTHCSGLPVTRYSCSDLASAFGPAFAAIATMRETHTTPSGNDQPFSWVVLSRRTGQEADRAVSVAPTPADPRDSV